MDELQALLQELLSAIDQVQASGEVLSDEFQGELARTLGTLFDRIEQERGSVDGLPPGQAQNQLEPAPHPSSNISRFKYDPENQNLVIQFLGKHPNRNGPQYSYEGVPPFIFDVFRRGAVAPKTSGKNAWHEWKRGVTPSHGASAYALIKSGNFPYQRIA